MPKMLQLLVAVVLCAAVMIPVAPAAASAPFKRERQTYLSLYFAVKAKQGKRAPGRQILKHGVKRPGRHTRPASAVDVASSIRTLRALLLPMMHPAKPMVPPAMAATARAGGIAACIRAHESTNSYTAVSPSGAYRGAYQFDYATFAAAGGHGDPAAASPAEQDAAFARWWPGHHSAWPVSGPACGG